MNNPYPTKPDINKGELPDLFCPPGMERVSKPVQWHEAAAAWRDLILDIEYGGLPPEPESVTFETLCHNTRRKWPGKPHFWSYKIHCTGGAKAFSFTVQILFPDREKPVPAIIRGDGCWWPVSDEIALSIVKADCALVMFNRTEMAEDLGYAGNTEKDKREGGLYDIYPGRTFGALSAWAWGYHRCVDLLYELPFIDKEKIAATGHSRGGKAALVAGAGDPRITLVNDNGSCAGGSALYRYVGSGGETLNILNVFPSWFGPKIRDYLEYEENLPFDQHCLLAAIAPRPLLSTFALDDRWSNPEGMVLSHRAASNVYEFIGQQKNIAFHLRKGGHAHSEEDWNALIDFINWKWTGHSPCFEYNEHPYTHLKEYT